MKILIAEDDLTSRTLLAGILKKRGHEVVKTVNGAEALAALQQPDSPSLAILDWMMPEIDGPGVVRRIRALKTDRTPYFIMLTTKFDKGDIIAALETGANDYLSKPFDAGELLARVEVGRRMVEMQDTLLVKIEELRQALNQVKTLSGFLPICMHCKNIRDDKGYWERVETYVSSHTGTQFSHGICPECMKKHYSKYCEPGDLKKRSG